MSPIKQRAARIAQAKHRGSTSHKTDLENALIVLAWEAELLSEGQCSRMLDMDRVSLRKLRTDTLDKAMAFAEAIDPPERLKEIQSYLARRVAALRPYQGGESP
jgi:hypothetical protein